MNDPPANLIGVRHVFGSDSCQEYNNHPYINMDANTGQGGSMPIGVSSQMLCGNNVLPMQDVICHKGVDSNFSQLSAYSNQMNMMNNLSYPQVFPNTPAVNHGIQDLNTPSMNFEDNFQPPVEQNLIFNNPAFSSVPNCSPPVPVDTLNTESYNLFHNNSTVESSSVSNCSVAPHSQFGFTSSLDSQFEDVTKSVDHSNNDFSTDDLFNSIDTELVQNAGDPFVDDQVQDDASVEQNIAELNHVITEHSTVNKEDVSFQENGTVSRIELEAPVCGVDEQPSEENITSEGNPELESVRERKESCEEDETLLLMNTREDSLPENEATQVDSLRKDKKEEFEKSSYTSEAMPFSEESMDSSLHCPQDMGDNVLSADTAVDESGPTKDFRGSDREESTEENDTDMLAIKEDEATTVPTVMEEDDTDVLAIEEDEATTVPTVMEENDTDMLAIEEDEATTVPTVMERVLEGSETSSVTNNLRHSTESNNDSHPDSAQVGSPCNVPSEDCESESRELVKNCLTAEISISKESGCRDEREENDEFSKAPISPMITMLDSNLGEDDEGYSAKGSDSESAPSTSKACSKSTEDDILGNVRPRRSRTRVPPSKSHYSVENVAAGWQSQESNLLTPSTIDKSITIPDNVLRVSPEEQAYYKKLFPNLDDFRGLKLHCTTCGRHVGAAPNKVELSNRHKVLRVLVCSRCHSFYGKGKFPKDSDGSELYCRWCGQGGEVVCCSQCPNVFCVACLRRNFGPTQVKVITSANEWKCVVCNYRILWHFRAVCWAVLRYSAEKKKEALLSQDPAKLHQLGYDNSTCCSQKIKKKKLLSQTGETCSTSCGDSSEKIPSLTMSLETCRSSPDDSSGKLPSVTVSLETCSSSPGDSPGKLPSDKLSLDNYSEGFARGHFLFSGGNDEDSASVRYSESDDDANEIDPSLFVQPVLEEPSPTRPPVLRNPHFRFNQPQPGSVLSRPGSIRTIRPTLPSPRVVPLTPARFSGPVSAVPTSSPRIFVRSPSSLLRPGLVPLSKKLPNKPPLVFLNENSGKKTTVASSGFRGSVPGLSNLDGVRSMEQLEAIDSVPWFRNGIDNLRAVGFALTKRLRDLEARFHTLKNKEDSEKVMALGKKLDRLTKQASVRFESIHSEMRAGCYEWKCSKLKRTPIFGRSSNLNPFVFIEDQDSDWEDSKELSRPLEKIIIPVSTAALQGGNTQHKLLALSMKGLPANISSNAKSVPMSISQRTMPSNMNSNAKSVPMSMSKITIPSSMNSRVSSLPVANKVMPGNVDITRTVSHARPVAASQIQSSFVRILPKPQEPSPDRVPPLKITGVSGNSWAKMLHNTNMVDSVGNSVSITMTSTPKRKREDSDFVDERNLRVQELMHKYNIQPCFVRLKRCDDLVASFQEQSRSKTVEITVFDSSNICNNDEDDDIQIIEEVGAESELLPTVLCTSTLCETID